jgi:hypothetical protein
MLGRPTSHRCGKSPRARCIGSRELNDARLDVRWGVGVAEPLGPPDRPDADAGTDADLGIGDTFRIERPEAMPGNTALRVRGAAPRNTSSPRRRQRRMIDAAFAMDDGHYSSDQILSVAVVAGAAGRFKYSPLVSVAEHYGLIVGSGEIPFNANRCQHTGARRGFADRDRAAVFLVPGSAPMPKIAGLHALPPAAHAQELA